MAYLQYKTGEVIKEGDQVLIENEKTAAIVDKVIDSREVADEFGVNEFGVLLTAAPFGSVFWPESEDNDPLVFVARGIGQDN